MTTEISFADWVDWLAVELTFVELYRSAPRSEKRELRETLRRLAAGIGEADLDAFVSQEVPNLERALDSFSGEERARFVPQLSDSVTDLAQHVASVIADRD
ncbi:MAG: hypothetical protein F4012_11505 [Gemmatimonadales bacterium]|nr:hypothetical protein [Gemmatimonadales bacterium]